MASETPTSEVLAESEATPVVELQGVMLAGRRATQPRLQVESLSIARGTTVVVGPSGSGKSTLLDVVCGLAVSGDRRLRCPAGARRPLFLGGSESGLWPSETVVDHLRLVGCDDATAGALLADFELLDVADDRPPRLSQGQRSRVSIARALAADAALLVLDEPLAHIDRRRQHHAREALHRWQEAASHRSLLVATHEVDWVSRFEHVVCLDEGRVVAEGATAALREHPPSESVAWSLGVQRVGASLQAAIRSVVLLVVCSLGVMGTLTGCLPSTEARPVEERLSYSLPPDGPRLPAPRAVTVAPDGRRVVLDNAGRILFYDENGTLLDQWAMPESDIGKPEGVHVSPDGHVAVADTHYSRVVVFTAEGEVERMFGSRGDEPGQFLFPTAIVQDDQGFYFVAEYGGGDRVQKFTAEGEHVATIGKVGSGPGEFQRPSGLAIVDDRLLVVDSINNRLHLFDRDGRFLRVLGEAAGLRWPYDIAVDAAGQFVVPEYETGTVAVIDAEGTLVRRYGGDPLERQFHTPWGLAIDAAGTMIVADTGHHRMVEFTPD